jgi:hypothetical protein
MEQLDKAQLIKQSIESFVPNVNVERYAVNVDYLNKNFS